MKIFKKISLHFFLTIVLASPFFVSAQNQVPPSGGSVPAPATTQIGVKIDNPFKGGNDLMSLINAILNNIIMPIAAVAVVVWIVWAGFQFVIAQGNPTALATARKNLLWSLIGAGILLGAAAISSVVKATIEALIKP